MNITTILIIANVFAAVSMIALTLMQSGKSDMGSAFGGGGSQSMFGSRGSSNFLSKATALMCAIFFLTSLALAYTYAKRGETSIVDAPSVLNNSNGVPIIDSPVVNDSGVPTIDAAELTDSIDQQVGELKDSADAQISELEAQVKGAIEQEKAKVTE